MNQTMNMIDYTNYLKPDDQQWRIARGVKGRQSAPLTAKNLPKIGKRGENQEKEGKIGKRENREGSFTFHLLTDRAGYAMTINQ